jgi:hypothetical protein
LSTGFQRQEPSLERLLELAGSYVARYVETFSNVVVEEAYVQDLTWSGRVRPVDPYNPQETAVPGRNVRRTLRSDLVLVHVGPPLEWRPFRDVFEVDGKPVRDRDDRLSKLFMQPAATSEEQAVRIAQESARFNLNVMGLSTIVRTLNAPGLALAFLQPGVQSRFQFTLDKRDGPTWVVAFEEHAIPTLFRHNGTSDNPSAGRFWIEPTSGMVTKIEHTMAPGNLDLKFTTTFREDAERGVAVPVELSEEISLGANAGYKLTGHATYSRFRRFSVSTETTTAPTR